MCKKREEGQAMVEFALILPILILLICGIIDFGRIFGYQIIANNATREAARYTAIHFNDSTFDNGYVITRIGEKAEFLIGADVDISTSGDDQIAVLVTKSIPIMTPMISIFFDNGSYELEAKSVMRLE